MKNRYVPLGIQEVNGNEYIGICIDDRFIAEVMRDSFTGSFCLNSGQLSGNLVCKWSSPTAAAALIPYSDAFAERFAFVEILDAARAYHDECMRNLGNLSKEDDLDMER